MQLYNTCTRTKESLETIEPQKVGMYSCGPTVYHYAHVGNMRTYLFSDLLKRTLRYLGYEVRHIMNITDVGHLTNDDDLGQDKMLLAALRDEKSVWEIAEYFTKVFKEHMSVLNIVEPEIWCKATDYISEQISLIKKLEEKGYTYITSDGVYFDTAKFPHYADFAKLVLDEQKAGARVEVHEEKRQPWDFALWKFSPAVDSGEPQRQMEWESPWGIGFPGWHIECSAMSVKFLGQPFDIHTGGIDHVPIHHTNEIAQSEAAYDKPLANYWLHAEFLSIDAKKMSKSSGVFLTLQDVLDKGYDPLAFRFFCLNAHYRQVLNFTWDALDAASNGLRSLRNKMAQLKIWATDEKAGTERSAQIASDLAAIAREQFVTAIEDDLGMPRALAIVFSLLDRVSHEKDFGTRDYRVIYDAILEFDQVFGLDLEKEQEFTIPDNVRELAELRATARAAKNWAESDKWRAEIELLGFEIKDSAEGYALLPKPGV